MLRFSLSILITVYIFVNFTLPVEPEATTIRFTGRDWDIEKEFIQLRDASVGRKGVRIKKVEHAGEIPNVSLNQLSDLRSINPSDVTEIIHYHLKDAYIKKPGEGRVANSFSKAHEFSFRNLDTFNNEYVHYIVGHADAGPALINLPNLQPIKFFVEKHYESNTGPGRFIFAIDKYGVEYPQGVKDQKVISYLGVLIPKLDSNGDVIYQKGTGGITVYYDPEGEVDNHEYNGGGDHDNDGILNRDDVDYTVKEKLKNVGDNPDIHIYYEDDGILNWKYPILFDELPPFFFN